MGIRSEGFSPSPAQIIVHRTTGNGREVSSISVQHFAGRAVAVHAPKSILKSFLQPLKPGFQQNRVKHQNQASQGQQKSLAQRRVVAVADPVLHLSPKSAVSSQSRFDVIGSLGKGCFGEAFKVKDCSTGQLFAAKAMGETDPNAAQEVSIMKSLASQSPHPNLVNLHCVYKGRDNKAYMVMDLAGENLWSRMSKGQHFKGNDLKRVMSQLAKGMEAMKTRGFQHNDIKPDNILLDGNGNLKICDFGKASALGGRWPGGPRSYSPPEVLSGSQPYSQGVDSWSYGCVMAEMITKKPLFPDTLWQLPKGERNRVTSKIIKKAAGDIHRREGREAADLFVKLMHSDPRKRLEPRQILNHPYLTRSAKF